MRSYFFIILLFISQPVTRRCLYAEDTLVNNGDTIIILNDGTWRSLNHSVATVIPTPPTVPVDSCESTLIRHRDKMTDRLIIASKEPIIITKDSKEGFVISLLLAGTSDIIFNVKVYGASSCIEEGTSVYLLFQDDSRIELKSNNEFNCEENMTFYMGRTLGKTHILTALKTKLLATMRIYTARSYIEEDIPEQQAAKIQQVINCLCKEGGL